MPRPIVEAVRSADLDKLRQLIEEGANVNEIEKAVDRRSALHWAAVHANIDAIDWLVGNGADLEAMDCQGHTPLHLSCIHGYPYILRRLLDYGADRLSR